MIDGKDGATDPTRHCDIIMKGGITSGVVYPHAVCKLAENYRFKNIGGSSAGAIAAAFLAAAEYRRIGARRLDGYDILRGLPAWFGEKRDGKSNLLSLFLPNAHARSILAVLVASIGPEKVGVKVARAVKVAILRFGGYLAVGLLPAVLLVMGLVRWPISSQWWAILASLPFVVVAGLALACAVIVGVTARRLPWNYFGLTGKGGETGYRRPQRPHEAWEDDDPPSPGASFSSEGTPPLALWLEEQLDTIAFGSGYEGDPLTFKDLLRTGAESPDGPGINLQVMTTCLTQRRPYRVPFSTREFYFHPDELGLIFSPRIVEYLKTHGRVDKDPELKRRAREKGLYPLPDREDLPVVVAARLSLSFPLLISIVPLWGYDFTYDTTDREGKKHAARLGRCWFSDGGIASNFPIHFFDELIPRWPTFAFNLTDFHPLFPHKSNDECLNTWQPRHNSGGRLENWSPFEQKGVVAFLGSIIDTMHNWRDNVQLGVPGYRDRIAQVHLRPMEGGMNLNMENEIIAALARRGECAAEALAARFGENPPRDTELTWDNHRWVRFRSTMSLLQQKLVRLSATFKESEGSTSYSQLFENPPHFKFSNPAAAKRLLDALGELAELWGEKPPVYADGDPLPQPELRMMPKV